MNRIYNHLNKLNPLNYEARSHSVSLWMVLGSHWNPLSGLFCFVCEFFKVNYWCCMIIKSNEIAAMYTKYSEKRTESRLVWKSAHMHYPPRNCYSLCNMQNTHTNKNTSTHLTDRLMCAQFHVIKALQCVELWAVFSKFCYIPNCARSITNYKTKNKQQQQQLQ